MRKCFFYRDKLLDELCTEINSGAEVNLNGVPPHLIEKIFQRISRADVLLNLQESNQSIDNIDQIAENCWKYFVNNKLADTRKVDLEEGESYKSYYLRMSSGRGKSKIDHEMLKEFGLQLKTKREMLEKMEQKTTKTKYKPYVSPYASGPESSYIKHLKKKLKR